MPLYDYECLNCKERDERFMPLSEKRDLLTCKNCGGSMKQIVVLGHGGFQSTQPRWLDDYTKGCLQDTDAVAAGSEKPIEDRADYDRHLKRHGIVPLH